MTTFRLIAGALIVSLIGSCASMGGGSKTEKQQAILSMKNEVLAELYAKKPDVRAQIDSAPGYAVFSNANVNLLILAAGTGYGVVRDAEAGRNIYMNMAEGGLGIGLGVKDYRVVMVFHSKQALNHFVENGWSVGGNADATAKAADKGASIEGEVYAGNVTVYTFTEAGIALQATIKGVKFWKDGRLN